MVDPRTPVLIGAGQLSHRVDRGEAPLEPVDLVVEAARRAAEDSGVGDAALTGLDAVHIVSILSFRYRDPAALVAERVGATPRDTTLSGMGGNSPQTLVNQTCLDIQAGRADLVLIGGAEAWRTRMAARAGNAELGWTEQGDDVPKARQSTPDVAMSAPGEQARGVMMPVQVYPIFEQALRIGLGRSVADHLVAVSELWAGFSEVAAANPHAWIQRQYSAEEIRTPSDDNRWVGFPYTKLMNSNNAVEQGAAVILCSAERAEALGVPRDRWVFPHSGTDAHDHYFVSERDDLRSSPAMRLAGRAALALAGDRRRRPRPRRPLLLLPERGGDRGDRARPRPRPTAHGHRRPVVRRRSLEQLRHALHRHHGRRAPRRPRAASGSSPPTAGSSRSTPSASTAPSRRPRRSGTPTCRTRSTRSPVAPSTRPPTAPIDIESYTVLHGRGGPESGLVVGLRPDGQRAWGTTSDADQMQAMLTEELGGRKADLRPDGAFTLS